MSRKKRSITSILTGDVIMAGIGVILFIAGVTAPFPDPVKIGFIVAGLACMAVAGSDFF